MYKLLFFFILTIFIISCGGENTEEEIIDNKVKCSQEHLDGICENDKSCIEGECKYDMKGIKLVLKSKDGNTLKEVETDLDGNFELIYDKLNMEGKDYSLEYQTSNTLAIRKRPGRVKYSNITLSRENITADLSFDTVFLGILLKDKPLIRLYANDSKASFTLKINGQISIYECSPKKEAGEPVTGAEIYVSQDPNIEPTSSVRTGDDGGFEIKPIEVTVTANNDKGGFAIGGYRMDKANNKKGGFAIGGYRLDKAISEPGYEFSIGGININILDPILSQADENGKFEINHLYINNNNDKDITGDLGAKGSLRTWDYTCE